jgi:hypothetical protein
MDDADELLDELARRPDCVLAAAAGQPRLPAGENRLPSDLVRFYERCGGALIHTDPPDFGLQVRAPADLGLANDELVAGAFVEPGDISEHWYVIANGIGSTIDLISIDLHPDRLGRCYDSFSEVHASPGDCAIVATSFTDLLRRALEAPRDAWWWTTVDFEDLGDAYEGIY